MTGNAGLGDTLVLVLGRRATAKGRSATDGVYRSRGECPPPQRGIPMPAQAIGLGHGLQSVRIRLLRICQRFAEPTFDHLLWRRRHCRIAGDEVQILRGDHLACEVVLQLFFSGGVRIED